MQRFPRRRDIRDIRGCVMAHAGLYPPRRNRECLTTMRLRKRLASAELRNDNYDRVHIANFLEENFLVRLDRELAETFSTLFPFPRAPRAVKHAL